MLCSNSSITFLFKYVLKLLSLSHIHKQFFYCKLFAGSNIKKIIEIIVMRIIESRNKFMLCGNVLCFFHWQKRIKKREKISQFFFAVHQKMFKCSSINNVNLFLYCACKITSSSLFSLFLSLSASNYLLYYYHHHHHHHISSHSKCTHPTLIQGKKKSNSLSLFSLTTMVDFKYFALVIEEFKKFQNHSH